jgi:hypothetical protein
MTTTTKKEKKKKEKKKEKKRGELAGWKGNRRSHKRSNDGRTGNGRWRDEAGAWQVWREERADGGCKWKGKVSEGERKKSRRSGDLIAANEAEMGSEGAVEESKKESSTVTQFGIFLKMRDEQNKREARKV